MTFSNQLFHPSMMEHRPTINGYSNGHSNGHSNGAPKHIFVFDNMRLRSHLFWRWMSTHPDLYSVYHPYLQCAFLGRETSILYKLRERQDRLEEVQQMIKAFGSDETYDTSNQQLEQEMEKAEKQGKRLFVNEHLVDLILHYLQIDFIRRGDTAFPSLDFEFPNPTYISDRLLSKFTPIILIRHPILHVQSNYVAMVAFTTIRPGGENFDCITSSHYARLIFEFFRLKEGRPPIVVDGEDILWRTDELGANLCNALGLDQGGLKDTWETLSKEWWSTNPFIQGMTKTICESTGIERPAGEREDLKLDVYVKKWTEKFGAETARLLKERVDIAMPHYNHLVQFKI